MRIARRREVARRVGQVERSKRQHGAGGWQQRAWVGGDAGRARQ